jgi:sulfite reductase (NADPH) hemoprotein beta-component
LEAPENKGFSDPLYGQLYLPRKFKVGFAIPPLNDVDVLANCCGFIAIVEDGRLAGYNLTAGGGMGRSHGNNATFPRLADVIGFLKPQLVVDTARAVLTIHRDFGDRGDRKHARLKYVLHDRGVAWFRAELEERLGQKLEDARPFKFDRQGDAFGWHEQADGRWFAGVWVESGRIKDAEGRRLRSALRALIEQFRPEIRLTPANNLILASISAEKKDAIHQVFVEHGINLSEQGTTLRRSSTACVALPTCGLALAESERYLPQLVGEVEQALAASGLPGEEIVIRVTGCPNGCARPYLAEIGLVGKAPGRYQVWLGGNESSTRMAFAFKENVKDTELIHELQPLFIRFAAERQVSERFGDWCARALTGSVQTAPDASAPWRKPE